MLVFSCVLLGPFMRYWWDLVRQVYYVREPGRREHTVVLVRGEDGDGRGVVRAPGGRGSIITGWRGIGSGSRWRLVRDFGGVVVRAWPTWCGSVGPLRTGLGYRCWLGGRVYLSGRSLGVQARRFTRWIVGNLP